MKMDKKYLEHVMTSGEAAMHAINQNNLDKHFIILGQLEIFIFLKIKIIELIYKNSLFILCTGLFDEYENDLDYYKKLLLKHVSKKFQFVLT